MKEYIVQAIVLETIDSFDTHNAPELIRCKDCKYAVLTYQGELKYCKYLVDEYGFTNGGDPLYLEGDFFCAAGERR